MILAKSNQRSLSVFRNHHSQTSSRPLLPGVGLAFFLEAQTNWLPSKSRMIITGLSLSDYLLVFMVFSPLKEPRTTRRFQRTPAPFN